MEYDVVPCQYIASKLGEDPVVVLRNSGAEGLCQSGSLGWDAVFLGVSMAEALCGSLGDSASVGRNGMAYYCNMGMRTETGCQGEDSGVASLYTEPYLPGRSSYQEV